jgi:hypothetical protein
MNARVLAPASPAIGPQARRPTKIHRKCACGAKASSSGQCQECAQQDALQRVRRKSASPAPLNGFGPQAATAVQSALGSPGRPLDRTTRSRFEDALGHDLAQVRIHTDAAAAHSARAIDALAYSAGAHVVFAHGRYAPESSAGARLLAHELTHTLQDATAPLSSAAPVVDAPDSAEEREADAVAEAVIARRAVQPIHAVRTPARLRRQPDPFECSGLGGEPLPARQWRKCVAMGKVDPGQSDPARFSQTGEIATPEALISWAIREGLDEKNVYSRMQNSHVLSGTATAIENAEFGLLGALQQTSIAQIKSGREEARAQKQREEDEKKLEAAVKEVVEDYYTRGERLKPYGATLLTIEEAAAAEAEGRSAESKRDELRQVTYFHGQKQGRFTVVVPKKAIIKVNDWYYYAVDDKTMYDVIHGIVAYAEQVWENTKGINVAYGYIVKAVGHIAGLVPNPLGQAMSPMMDTAGEGILYNVRKTDARKAGDVFTEAEPEIGWRTLAQGGANVVGGKIASGTSKLVGKVWKPAGPIVGFAAGFEASNVLSKSYDVAVGNLSLGEALVPDLSPIELIESIIEAHVFHKFSERWTKGKAPKVPAAERTPPVKLSELPAKTAGTTEKTDIATGTKPAVEKGKFAFKTAPKGLITLDKVKARWSEHEMQLTDKGLELCSPGPCPLLKKVYRRELKQNEQLSTLLDHLEEQRLANPGDKGLQRKSLALEERLGELKARNDLLDAIPEKEVRARARGIVEVGVGLDRGQLEGFAQAMAKARSKGGRQRLVQTLEDVATRANIERNKQAMAGVDPKADADVERAFAEGEVTSSKAGKTGGSTAPRQDPTKQDIDLNIDEIEAVGAEGTLDARRERALSLNNREFKDPLTNQRTKHVKIDARDLARMKKVRKAVSLKMQETVKGQVRAKTRGEYLGLWSRRFSEIVEVKAIGERILNDMEGTTTRLPGELKAELNRRMWDEFKNPTTPEGAIVNEAIRRSGFDIIDTPDGRTGLRALTDAEWRSRGFRFVEGQGYIPAGTAK